jgi:hypothetical protein
MEGLANIQMEPTRRTVLCDSVTVGARLIRRRWAAPSDGSWNAQR